MCGRATHSGGNFEILAFADRLHAQKPIWEKSGKRNPKKHNRNHIYGLSGWLTFWGMPLHLVCQHLEFGLKYELFFFTPLFSRLCIFEAKATFTQYFATLIIAIRHKKRANCTQLQNFMGMLALLYH